MFEMQELMVTIPAAEAAGLSPAAERPPTGTYPDLAEAVTPDEPCDDSGCDDSGCDDSGCDLSTCQLADSCPGGSSCDLEASVCIGETWAATSPPAAPPAASATRQAPARSPVPAAPPAVAQRTAYARRPPGLRPGGPTTCPAPFSICRRRPVQCEPRSICPVESTCPNDTRCETESACGPTASLCQAPSTCEAPSACGVESRCTSTTLEAAPPDQQDRNAQRPDAAFDLDELKASLKRRLTSRPLPQQTGSASDRRD